MSSPSIQTTHYLRIEGVNLASFVFDTRDLSTNRGGSLLLLNAITTVKDALARCAEASAVSILSQGASSGLFALTTSSPEMVVESVRSALNIDDDLPQGTFVVDILAIENFPIDREKLIAANRWRQMQASTLAVPPSNLQTTTWSQPACDLDGLRPVEGSRKVKQKEVSESTWRRREYGRSQKQKFYEGWTGLPNLPAFANDFETIAAGSKSLKGKIAVFYADGNGFGGIQAMHCQDETNQQRWDDLVRGRRREFLTAFLATEVGVGSGTTLADDSPWGGTQQGGRDKGNECVRFETLLWGGDEFMFVMPAELGWSFATFFFKKFKGMKFGGRPISHAAALVFCQHHSPIHRLKRLAKDQMTEFAKEQDRDRDSLLVTALESFDHLGTDFEGAMKRRYKEKQGLEKMMLKATDKRELHEALSELAEGVAGLRGSESFPRSQLRGLVNEMLASSDAALIAKFAVEKDEDDNTVEQPPRHFRNMGDEDRKHLASLRNLFPDDPVTLWLQLEELWDYARS